MIRVLKKIKQDNKEFVTSEELQIYSKDLYLDYRTISNYLVTRGFLLNILDDIYYVKSEEEILQNKLNYSILELVGKGLELKNVKNWYFGLYTALNLINFEYEHENDMFYLINDQIIKEKPIKILGKDFRFLTFKNALFNFGIIDNKVKYSDHEKTILDLIYLWQYNHMNESRILIEAYKLLDGISEEKILDYSQYYPNSNRNVLKKALNKLKGTH
ncbi:MAG: hypothetical protein CEE43_04965 [Promethearchaeota archaeon Loki_b32]|nr:MAG: hypothetical protein CEE43_04965 [Candidatus Lokiarchaeota archaeon Loki_b32]